MPERFNFACYLFEPLFPTAAVAIRAVAAALPDHVGSPIEAMVLDFQSHRCVTFKHHGHCDDGAIAEGYSDKIVSLLVNRWGSVEELFHLWRTHPEFGRFITAHVDELMSPEQAKTITKVPAGF